MERRKAPRKWIKQGMGCEGRAKKTPKKKVEKVSKTWPRGADEQLKQKIGHRVRDRRLIGTAALLTAVASVGHVPPRLRKHILRLKDGACIVPFNCVECRGRNLHGQGTWLVQPSRAIGSCLYPFQHLSVMKKVVVKVQWTWLGMYASPQPFSKHVLVFIDIFQPYGSHVIRRVLWRGQSIRFFGDTNSDSPPSMVSVFGNCFGLYAGSGAGLGIVWIPSQY